MCKIYHPRSLQLNLKQNITGIQNSGAHFMQVIIQSHVVVQPSFLVDDQEDRQICFLGSYFCCAGKMWLGSLSCIAGTSHNQYWTWRQTNYLFNLFQNRNQAAFSPTEVASFKRRIQVTEWSETSWSLVHSEFVWNKVQYLVVRGDGKSLF